MSIQMTLTGANYAWARARQLEGTWPGDPQIGVWPITYNRVIYGWGQIPEEQRQFRLTDHPEPNPSSLDQHAKDSRIGFYSRVWDSYDCKRAFSRGSGVSASFRVTEQWRNPADGRLDFDQSRSAILGGHTMAILPTVPYAPVPIEWSEDSTLVAMNSWGRQWGSNGWGAMTHEFFDREMYEAWAIEPKAAFPRYFGTGRQLIEWIPGSYPDRTFFAFSIVDADTDNRQAWTMAVHRRGEIHVEDLYVKPEFRRQGLGSELMARLQSLQQELQQPLRFWIPFADVEDRSSFTFLQEWFAANGFSIGAPQRSWAAASAMREVDAIEYSSIQLPPKPAYLFQNPCTDNQVDWQSVRGMFNVSQEFVDAAADVFSRHSEVLRRLA